MSIVDWLAKRSKTTTGVDDRLNIPGNLWVKCFSCNSSLYTKDLEANLKVCPSCGYHFRLSAHERIELLSDQATFVELHANIEPRDPIQFVDTKAYKQRIKESQEKTGLRDAVVCGRCSIQGQPTTLAVMDFGFMGGSMGGVIGEKITRTIETAIAERLPFISVSASGGARMQEGIFSLMQMAKTSTAIARLKAAGQPYLVILTDPTTGGTTASFAMLGDIHIAEKGALIGFAGPRVIEQTIRQKLPKGFQTAEYLLEHGMVDLVLERKALPSTVGNLLRLLCHAEPVAA